jgi:hypothetical protein
MLLDYGLVAGPLFMIVALAQAFTRAGFDVIRIPLSQLGLGDAGWIQVTDFVVSGLLFLAFAAGVRRVLRPGSAGRWGPLLLAGFGVGMTAAGIFRPDPALGFPPGAPAGTPATLTWHNQVHGLAFGLSFGCLVAAAFVFAHHFRIQAEPRWRALSGATGAGTGLLIACGLASAPVRGLAFIAAAAAATSWAAFLAFHLRAGASHPGTRRHADRTTTSRQGKGSPWT